MRLIDADALADALFEKRKNYPQWVADTIGNMPTIDALALLKEQDNCENCAIAIEDRQPVVRCRDCIHKNGLNHCPHNNDIWVADDWFCADGERNNGKEES